MFPSTVAQAREPKLAAKLVGLPAQGQSPYAPRSGEGLGSSRALTPSRANVASSAHAPQQLSRCGMVMPRTTNGEPLGRGSPG